MAFDPVFQRLLVFSFSPPLPLPHFCFKIFRLSFVFFCVFAFNMLDQFPVLNSVCNWDTFFCFFSMKQVLFILLG